ncbi:hypothetical protein [Alkalibacterium sp. 20]|uniref:hypothetical protein n=1 Tax=Alkalibacterium sp. 20 TaxID=1798803 RepID=UPI0015A68F74|nr:hypothetical protein [Alkalibacterium sp. 20]
MNNKLVNVYAHGSRDHLFNMHYASEYQTMFNHINVFHGRDVQYVPIAQAVTE